MSIVSNGNFERTTAMKFVNIGLVGLLICIPYRLSSPLHPPRKAIPYGYHEVVREGWATDARLTDSVKATKRDEIYEMFAQMEESVFQQFEKKKREFDEADSRAPPYMIELYQRFSTNKYALPSSNIVRSFLNEETEVSSGDNEFETFTRFNEIFLSFNVTIPVHEKVVLAELRLFFIVKTQQGSGAFAKISIYEDNEDENGFLEKVLVKHVYKENNGWETFDLTGHVTKQLPTNKKKHLYHLRVQIDDIIQMMVPDTSHDLSYLPLLVIYSDDRRTGDHQLQTNELENMIEQEELINLKLDTNLEMSRRKRALSRKNYCQKREMVVDFKDIGYENWIIAPTSYQAFRCSGRCVFPLTDRWSPTKHAVIQTLVHEIKPKKIQKPCCVPNNLDPISILYVNEGVITYKHKYEGMVVKDCACR